jgi:hypothetical protein
VSARRHCRDVASAVVCPQRSPHVHVLLGWPLL